MVGIVLWGAYAYTVTLSLVVKPKKFYINVSTDSLVFTFAHVAYTR